MRRAEAGAVMTTEAGKWVQGSLDAHHRRVTTRRRSPLKVGRAVLSDFHHRAVRMLARAQRRGIYDVQCAWERQDWSHPDMLHLTLYAGSFATYDFDHLTRLVLSAHEECIRVSIEPVAPRYLRIGFHPRTRDPEAPKHARHPTIEQAIEDFRR